MTRVQKESATKDTVVPEQGHNRIFGIFVATQE